jgi:hypothetical protein
VDVQLYASGFSSGSVLDAKMDQTRTKIHSGYGHFGFGKQRSPNWQGSFWPMFPGIKAAVMPTPSLTHHGIPPAEAAPAPAAAPGVGLGAAAIEAALRNFG